MANLKDINDVGGEIAALKLPIQQNDRPEGEVVTLNRINEMDST